MPSCKKCGGEVETDVSRCRHCGYDTASHSKYRWLWGIPGFVLTMSLVGSPIGIPMLWKAYKHRKAYEGSVAG